MAKKYTNSTNIPLPFAVLLATDNYDFVPDENAISVTTLLKSTRQIVLGRVLQAEGNLPSEDINDLRASALGTAIHSALEAAWQEPQNALRALGYGKRMVDRLKVNPTEWDDPTECVWTEVRTAKEIAGMTVSGSTDLILCGQVCDYKTTSVYSYLKGDREAKHRMQLSIYAWLNPDKVTSNVGYINYWLTNWTASEAKRSREYPQSQIIQKELVLMDKHEVETFLRNKIGDIRKFTASPDLPECTSEELWQSEGVWQYFSKPENTRASANLSTQAEANLHRLTKGKGKGVVRYKPAKVYACGYCNASSICSQYKKLLEADLIN